MRNTIYRPITAADRNTVQVGEPVQFLYHGKPREGHIEKAMHTFITLKFETDAGDAFKSFNFDKMGS